MRPVYWLAAALIVSGCALVAATVLAPTAEWALPAVVAGYMCGVSAVVLVVIDMLASDR